MGFAVDEYGCDECLKLTLELASATTEAVAIEREILARKRAGHEVSPKLCSWSMELHDARAQILEALRTHRETHLQPMRKSSSTK
jgi:hypothetical protein